MKKPLLFLSLLLLLSICSFSQTIVDAGRMDEVFLKEDVATAAANLNDPWEITYGPDDSLWITEVKGYKVSKIHPTNFGRRVILDLNTFTDPASVPTTKWQKQSFAAAPKQPQGGLMGMAIHPEFMTNPAKRWVYLAYIQNYDADSIPVSGGPKAIGILYNTWIVRFTANSAGNLVSPVVICDTITGGSDHNSGRLIIAPVGGVNYLFEAVGDLGAGQFEEVQRTNNAQNLKSYEGKILRWNLEPDGDAGAYDKWIPSTVADPNPFNGTPGISQSAVYCYGIRNNQGFAYDPVNNKLYGASHGPFTDDELNILVGGKNYGHPLVEGMSSDDNYNGSRAATATYAGKNTSLPLIVDESTNAGNLGGAYQDPIFSAYAASQATVNNLYVNNPANGGWPSEGWSGIDFYPYSKIPGWKNSILLASLKWGRVVKLRLNTAGTAVIPTAGQDTVSYFGSRNRFRDVAFDPNGRSFYVVMERSTTSSGPSNANPIVPDCLGCIHKYTFLGYNNNAGASRIPTTMQVARGTNGSCKTLNVTNINANNYNLWVPITDDSSNVIAEIKANTTTNAANMGNVTASFYYRVASNIREVASSTHKTYADRNVTITPAAQPTSSVDIRIYITDNEFLKLKNTLNSLGQTSGITTIADVAIFKNNQSCNSSLVGSATQLTTTGALFGAAGNGYVLTAATTSFSTFFFASKALTTLPVNLISFTGDLQGKSTELDWTTAGETNTHKYVVERSFNGIDYEVLGDVAAIGNSSTKNDYHYTDIDAANQPAMTLYYRLKIYDNDESFGYSNVVKISLTSIAGKVLVNPNPTQGITKVSLTAATAGKATWKIIDNAGHVMMENSITVQSGNNTFTVNAGQLAAGMYYMSVSGPGINQKVKFQKL